MSLKIGTNTASINTQRYLGISSAAQAKSLERLSSGYKINKAADDAAGIAIATKLNVKTAAMAKSIDNGNQALAMLQTAEGGMDQISNILTRLKEIATQSASANTTDRAAMDEERTNLEAEINKIAKNTRYGTTSLLQGDKTVAGYGAGITVANGVTNVDVTGASTGSFTMTMSLVTGGAATLTLTDGTTTQSVSVTGLTGLTTGVANFSNLGVKITINAAGATIAAASGGFSVSATTGSFQFQVGDTNATENQITSSLKNFDYNNSAVLALSGSISTSTAALSYMTSVDTAITNLTTERGKLGASINQISYHVSNLETMNENTKSAVSTLKDADFATEMADFTKFQILQQSGVAMLAQANQLPQMVLALLK